MLSNELYNLMSQAVEEQRSLWRIENMYTNDAGNCETCNPFWDKMKKDKEEHINELTALIKQHLS